MLKTIEEIAELSKSLNKGVKAFTFAGEGKTYIKHPKKWIYEKRGKKSEVGLKRWSFAVWVNQSGKIDIGFGHICLDYFF